MNSPRSRDSTRILPAGVSALNLTPANPTSTAVAATSAAGVRPYDSFFRFAAAQQVPAQRVVHVDRRESRDGSSGAREQPPLGGGIALHVAVEIQVVLRQVRKDRRMEVHAEHSADLETVRRNFHGCVRAANIAQLGQKADDVQRFGRRVDRRRRALSNAVLDRPQPRRDSSRRAQERVDQIYGRGLAVGAGDARQLQLAVGPAVKAQRGCGQRPAPMPHRCPAVFETLWGGSLAHNRRGARGDRLRNEAVSVNALAGERKESVARPYLPRVVLHPGYAQGRNFADRYACEHCVEPHPPPLACVLRAAPAGFALFAGSARAKRTLTTDPRVRGVSGPGD